MTTVTTDKPFHIEKKRVYEAYKAVRSNRGAAGAADVRQPAVVLAAVKDKPSGRPQVAAVLDRRCARRPHHRAGRDGRMAPPGTELKIISTQEASMPSNHTA